MPFSHVYGAPPPELAEIAEDARQFSPLFPDAEDLAALAPGQLPGLVMLAPPGVLERRFALALALRALAPGAPLRVLAPKDRGGSRLAKELAELSCPCNPSAKRHHRICDAAAQGDAQAIEKAIEAGAPRFSEELGLWTQPGVFSWDRIDPGSDLLMRHFPDFEGRGADLGCGLGLLAHAILRSPRVSELLLVDIDRRAIDCCRRNVADARAQFFWADARDFRAPPLDFVVMNPPFHDHGAESKALGLAFIDTAAALLRPGGQCCMVANRHLPYEAALAKKFRRVTPVAETAGYKIFEARK